MLVLARKCGEAIVIADGTIVLTILESRGDHVRIGVEAPPEVTVHRHEVWERIQNESKDAGVDGASGPATASASVAVST